MGTDSNDRPAGPSTGGQAVQNWSLLRLIPMLIFNVVDVTTAESAFLLLLRGCQTGACTKIVTSASAVLE